MQTDPTIGIPQALFDHVHRLAHQLHMPPEHLIERALAHFLEHGPRLNTTEAQGQRSAQQQAHSEHLSSAPIINQGEIFWVRPQPLASPELGYYPHPYVVVQENIFNHSRVESVIVCALTSNAREAHMPGNVLLEPGEANLPKQSIVVVSKISAVHKSQLGAQIGTLSAARTQQVLAGIRFLQQTFFQR